jgi:hypothetical protein
MLQKIDILEPAAILAGALTAVALFMLGLLLLGITYWAAKHLLRTAHSLFSGICFPHFLRFSGNIFESSDWIILHNENCMLACMLILALFLSVPTAPGPASNFELCELLRFQVQSPLMGASGGILLPHLHVYMGRISHHCMPWTIIYHLLHDSNGVQTADQKISHPLMFNLTPLRSVCCSFWFNFRTPPLLVTVRIKWKKIPYILIESGNTRLLQPQFLSGNERIYNESRMCSGRD